MKRRRKAIVIILLSLLVICFLSVFEIYSNTETIKNLEVQENRNEDEIMRLATYNQMFGMYGRSPIMNILGHISFHILHSTKLTNLFSRFNKKDVEFVSKVNADIVSLNEVLGSLKKKEIKEELRKKGYKYFCWDRAEHYAPSLDIGTLLASKEKFRKLEFDLPMESHFGGGGGACAINLKNKNLSILAVHLGLRKELIKKQLKTISKFVHEEKKKNNDIILMGDFNLDEKKMESDSIFEELNLTEANDEKTSPNINFIKFFDFENVDNIFYCNSFKIEESEVLDGYSDHKLVWADISRKN